MNRVTVCNHTSRDNNGQTLISGESLRSVEERYKSMHQPYVGINRHNIVGQVSKIGVLQEFKGLQKQNDSATD